MCTYGWQRREKNARERTDKTKAARWKNNFHDKMGKLLIFASIFAWDILFLFIFQFFKKLVSGYMSGYVEEERNSLCVHTMYAVHARG